MVRTRGRKFKPSERYTNRLNKILVEYPDGPQVLREILQNSDDSKSTEQIFILDHNTYPSESLLEPTEDNYHNSDLKLDRYQGPALLAINNTIFEERDFTSLLNLANSEKRDQFDKIGVMGVGFNSIYHVTDSPSFITGDTYVILDPHEWYFDGGEIYDIVEDNMVQDFPDQLAPFKIPSLGISCENSFNRFDGTMFRYPLRTEKDSQDSEIYKKIYKPKEVLEMFHKFYENESINCLLFLKYVEKITFYELKKGATKPDLLYEIRLENAVQVREQRRLIVKNIVPMMNSLISGKRNDIKQLESSYVASFRRKRGNEKGDSDPWLILNYLDDLLEAEKYYQKNFSKSIGEHKFIPNVGLAVPLKNLDAAGRLFCFLPLPISMPFLVSVHGYFAVSTNRRSLWAPADNEDLASDAIARLKVSWNQYLFEKVLPKAWVKFLRELPRKVPNISSDHLYKFWPKDKGDTSGTMNHFCKDLLQNVIEHLSIKDRVFRGPSSLNNAIGKVSGISADSYDASSFQASEFHWLSLANGYLNDNMTIDLSTVGSVGFPIISAPFAITKGLKKSKHKTSRKIFAPAILRDYLKHNLGRWQGTLAREEVLKLFGYLLRDEKFDELVDFRMIPLADGTFGKLSQSSNSLVYIVPYNINSIDRDEFNVFNDQLNKFIDMSISYELYDRLYKLAKDGWILNIKILDEFAIADMIRFTLNSKNVKSEEINHNEWIYKLWDNLSYRRWDLKEFENVHLIPTSRSTLRRLKTPQRIFYHQPSSLISIFEKFSAVFVNKQFDKVVERDGVSSYIIKPNDIVSVLSSFRAAASYPRNLEHDLQPREASILIDHLSNYLRLTNNLAPELIEVIIHLPIFTVVDQNSPISLLSGNANWFLLPKNEENSYGKIIYPSNRGRFLNASSQNLCYLLEYIIKVPRLESYNYWRNYVMPFLGSQQQGDRDSVIDKLFDKLPNLLYRHSELRDFFGNIPFVPTGTLQMSQRQQLPNNFKLAKPVELFNPEEKSVVDLFFENEQFFPAGRYGSGKFFSNLKSLGLKIILSPDDIISRIKNIVARSSNVNEALIRQQALKLLKYLDDKWGQLIINDHLMYVILNEKWIPTVDKSQNEIFSKPQDCFPKRDKNLVCFVAPILDYSVKNREFSKRIGWNTYPSVNLVLEQLKFCCVSLARKQPPEELTTVCDEIYKHMSKKFFETNNINNEFGYMKKYLEKQPWILCGSKLNKFYSADKVVFRLLSEFKDKDSLIVELPIDYTSKYMSFFKAMGVRDEIGVKDLILIIKSTVEGNKDRVLLIDEIKRVIQILEQISRKQKDNKRDRKDPEILDGLLIPSTQHKLVKLDEIQFDDLGDKIDENERSNYNITHHLVTRDIAEGLEIGTLTGKIYGIEAGDDDWDVYEQEESLTTRIQGLIKEYSITQLFKEFLQNADDAKAKRFSVILDERPINYDNTSKKSLLSQDMVDMQGPALWIYNDVEFTDKDFRALLKLGKGSKSNDENTIGRFGTGFNCAFHITDLPSIVSGKYIAFLDPNAKFLPAQGYPPRRRRGTRINFIEKEFKGCFPDQCYPYEAIEGCDLSKEFKGTLFRLPLRTFNSARKSEISKKAVDIRKILQIFSEVQGNKEMLFLRNIESCSFYHMKNQNMNRIWEVKIDISDPDRKIRKSVIDKMQTYQLTNEIVLQNRKVSETWILCTGGHEKIKMKKEIKQISEENGLKPRGGVAMLLSKSEEIVFGEPKFETFPDLDGEFFSYLSLSVSTRLNVHLNGSFSLSSSRSNILQSGNDFINADCDDSKWNRYILYNVLPDLHVKLLEAVVRIEEARFRRDRQNFVPHLLWPIKDYTNLYKDYGLNVIVKLGLGKQKFFWTKAKGGQFVSLQTAKFLEENDNTKTIANILGKLGVSVVILEKSKLKHLDEAKTESRNINFKYTILNGKLVCEELQRAKYEHGGRNDVDNKNQSHESLFELLNFILKDKDKNTYRLLNGLQLVPLSDGSIGKFGNALYIGNQACMELFPSSASRFISHDIPEKLLEIFDGEEFNDFSEITHIKKLDITGILELLESEIPMSEELEWDPQGESIPYNNWYEKIWTIFKNVEDLDFDRFSNFPLLSMVEPPNVLVRPDPENPLLYIPENGHTLFPILVKLKVRFTELKLPEGANADLRSCIVKCTSINILNALKNTCSLFDLNMIELFENSELSTENYDTFRTFIKRELESLIEHAQHQQNFMEILRSLPIWPTHSSEELIDATSGILLPYKLPFFAFQNTTDFYKCNHDSDFNALTKLGANQINELVYVRDHLLKEVIYPTPEDSPNYIPFLQNVLTLENPEIERYFRNKKVIPNKSLSDFVRADELYDRNEPLFPKIFANDDKFLPIELQNRVCLEALGRIGLKRQVNEQIFIECAEEVKSQIECDELPSGVVKDRANYLVRYLYEHIDTLNFNPDQWKRILEIKFVPSERNFTQFYRNHKETSGFETLGALCSRKYKKLCWTQCPLFDEIIDPTKFTIFNQHHPEIGIPSTENVMEHWFYVVDNIELMRSSFKETKSIIKNIYKTMNERALNEEVLIKLKIKNPKNPKKILLNGDEPFDKTKWVEGKELVFGLSHDIQGMLKINEFLEDYENLLEVCGAKKFLSSTLPVNIIKHDQQKVLVDRLLERFMGNSDRYHDVTFIVGDKTFRANRYVLSAASKEYFEKMFEGEFNESNGSEIEVTIVGIQPDAFWVLLQWLHGQSFEDAIESVLQKQSDFKSNLESYETYYLDFFESLLKATDIYDVEPLKNAVENTIINSTFIGINNVCKTLGFSKDYKANQLKEHCKNILKTNIDLVLDLRLGQNASNVNERANEKLKLRSLLSG